MPTVHQTMITNQRTLTYFVRGSNTIQTIGTDSIVGGRHSSVVSSAPTILRPRVQIPSTSSMLFSICVEIVTGKE